jgi:hypothetical protein
MCSEGFPNKMERDNHYRGECLTFIRLTDLLGNINQVERVDGKFSCPLCLIKFKYSNKLVAHWKECQERGNTESNFLFLGYTYFTGNINNEDPLIDILRYDSTYQLAICVGCEFALPLEWITKHFKDTHKLMVLHKPIY